MKKAIVAESNAGNPVLFWEPEEALLSGMTMEEAGQLLTNYYDLIEKADKLLAWVNNALDDPQVCKEYKTCIIQLMEVVARAQATED